MKSLVESINESILGSVGAGKNSDECFRKVFITAISKSFGNYIYEKGLEVYVNGNYARVYYPLVKGRERIFTTKYFEYCIANFVDELGDCREPYYAQEGITRKNRIDDDDEQVLIRTKIYITGDVPMFKKIDVPDYLYIGVFKDPEINKPAYLCIDATPEQIKKLYNK